MGTRVKTPPKSAAAAGLADALFGRSKQRVLALLYGQPARSFGIKELIGLAHSGSGAVQRELERLVESGLVAVEPGPQKRYRANRAAPIFAELASIVEKTAGVPQVLRDALAVRADAIAFAVLYGSVAKGTDSAASDLDVLVVSSELGLAELYELLQPAEARLGRPVSPTLYAPDEFRRRRRANHPFLSKVLGGPHTVLLGSEDAGATAR